jgi:small-conductance mechanosensitive channel
MVTLGSSSAVSNAVSGTVLVYTRAFNVGDIVRIGDSSGRVLERTLLTTRLRTASNEVVTIPNGHVLSGGIVNYSSEAQTRPLRTLVPVGTGYDVDWRTVHGLLLSAAGRTGEVLGDPEPFVRQRSLDSASVSYELIAHTGRPDCALQTRSELLGHVLDVFKEAGIEVLSPSYSAIRDGNPSTIPAPGPSDAGPGAATD